VPPAAFRLGQALVGITIGTLVSVSALREMASGLLPIVLVTLGAVVISLLAGRVLALRRDVSPVTGAFALIAGGASGVVAVARELGADERVVTVVQYLRVMIVLATLPLVTALVFHPDARLAPASSGGAPLWADLVYVAAALVVGLLLARAVPISTAVLLGPMLVAAVIAAAGWLGAVSVPDPLQWLAYALIGVQVGLRFTRASLSSIARMAPVVVAIILTMIAATAVMGTALARLTPVDPLTAYLATTPGGLFAVLATAADSGADVSYVLAAQLFRLLVILALVPVLSRWLRER
jgi:membrane AbrB-like protein